MQRALRSFYSARVSSRFTPIAAHRINCIATMAQAVSPLKVTTWNIAAINNNPFEYWLTYDDVAYNHLMDEVQVFINTPGKHDKPVSEVFTQDMFNALMTEIRTQGWPGIDTVEEYWNKDLRGRLVVTEFLKDKALGSKRLISMPDRMTNTINVKSSSTEPAKLYRPTAINCYDGHFEGFGDWWNKWLKFMFKTPIESPGKQGSNVGVERPSVVSMLSTIESFKYPALSKAEEAMSLPLQVLCLAVFDAILVDMLERIAPTAPGDTPRSNASESAQPKSWQTVRTELATALNLRKVERTIEILEESYADQDVLFIQEAASAFVSHLSESSLALSHHVIAPLGATARDQNSLILINKAKFDVESVAHVGEKMESLLPSDIALSLGDLLAVTVMPKANESNLETKKMLLACFHGDTNGLMTIPVVQAVHKYMQANEPDSVLLFGLDANTYEHGKAGKQQGMQEFVDWYKTIKMNSCWGPSPDAKNYTTFNARTFLQPQLNKASTRAELRTKGDVNPKDFVLFYEDSYVPGSEVVKDNTGEKRFIDDAVFPTIRFPSDHAVVSFQLTPKL